jgi:outer membrane translocation and assembly module TamA
VLRLDDVAEARRRLYQTGVFKRIDVTTSEDGDDAVVTSAGDVRDTTVTFDLQESRRYQLSYGGRYESDRGFSGVVDFVDTHSLGRGQTSGVRLIYGEEKKRLRLYHMIPRIVGQRSTLELFVEGRDDVEELANVEGIEGWAQLTFPVAGHQMRTYAVVESRDVTPLDPDVPVDDLVLSPRFGWQAVFSGLDNALGVTRRKGTFVGLDISGSSQALGSDASSIAAFAQFKWFLPFRWFSWAQSWRSGVQEAFEEEIPFVDRLRAGGEFSVRGYPTNSLGPLDANGVSLGGEVLFVVNQELHRRIWRSLQGLVFFDAGNVWFDRDSLDSDLFKSAGFGLRYASPVGPLRMDVGFPLDRRPEDPEYQVYFGFGTVF